MEWTKEQRRAITARAEGILVSAAAGSGKTAVLVERIISMIKGGADVSEILVSTFTNAAAASMRDKIYRALYDEHLNRPEDSHIRRQLTMVYSADIGTIHSFCKRLIRSCFFEAGVSPDFRIASDDEARIMKARVMSRTLDELFEQGDADFLCAGEMFVRKSSDKRFSRLLLSLYEKLVALPFYEDALDRAVDACDIGEDADLSDSVFGRELLIKLRVMAEAYLSVYENLEPDYSADEKYAQTFGREIGLLRSLAKSCLTWDEAYELLCGAEFPKFPAIDRKKDDEAKHYRYKDVRDVLKDDLKPFCDKIFTDRSASLAEDIRGMLPAVRGLRLAILAFAKNYGEEKTAAGILDFNDLEHTAVALLCKRDEDGAIKKTELSKTLSKRYRQIFIDEYQDLNTIQELIFQALSRDEGKNLFMVGDVKQSIYGFRQANPRIFLEKYAKFSKEQDAKENALILLSTNFRSRAQVIDAVNAVFSEIMSVYAGELSYTRAEFLYHNDLYNAPEADNTTEFYLIQPEKKDADGGKDGGDGDGADEEELSSTEREARLAAKLILSKINEGFPVFDTKSKTSRPASFGDFAVLLRSVNPYAAVYEKTFAELQIPVSSQSKDDFFTDPDVLLILSILRVIDNPMLDIPLAAVMRSPIFNFSDDEIMTIRLGGADMSLYDAVGANARAGCKKCAHMLRYIEKARLLSKDMTAPELLDHIYESTSVKALLLGLRGGASRVKKLQTLFKIACDYEQSHYSGLFGFILYIDYLIENNIEIESSGSVDEGADAVKIMSIHKSKGLEFPVCIVAGLGKKFNTTDLSEPVLFEEKLGLGCDFFDAQRLIYYPTAAKLALKERLERRAFSEEMRTLYVAMTRAMEKLILIGTGKYTAKSAGLLGTLSAADNGYFTTKAKSFLDLLLRGFKVYEAGEITEGSRVALPLSCGGELSFVLLSDAGEVSPAFASSGEEAADGEVPDTSFIRERLCFEYPFAQYAAVPQKLSATEIKGRLMEVEKPYEQPMYIKHAGELKTPEFYKRKHGEADGSAERGTAMHLFMELVDFSKTNCEKELKAQAEAFAAAGRMTPRQAEMLDYGALMRFFGTEIFARMKRARALYREKRFFMASDASLFYDVEPGGADIMVQGVIDCFFEDENGAAVLIDFKTDKTSDEDVLRRRYKGQLDVYKRAVSEVFGLECAEVYVYGFYAGRLVSFGA
ncbi:MAG: helicase-exonuclease AddAB subunit AddA [Clostridia bacterium]|nr:helicase-exonuclease AddAB subunit AddA [Clostridia bacterium]